MASSLLSSLLRPHLISWGRDARSGISMIRPPSSSSIRFCASSEKPKNMFSGSKVIRPWLMLPPSLYFADMEYNFYNLASDAVMTFKQDSVVDAPDDDAQFVGSSHGWLVSYSSLKGHLLLSNPITCRHLKLPSPHNLLAGPGPMSVHNVLLSSPPDHEDCRAVIIFGPQNRLAYCCPGRSADWTPICGDRFYSSAVYSKRQNLFFCATDLGVEAWDLRRLDSPVMIPMGDAPVDDNANYPVACSSEEEKKAKCMFRRTKFLAIAEESDDLFQLRRFTVMRMGADGSHVKDILTCDGFFDISLPYKTVDFDVYKYDADTGGWKYMDGSLDGMTLFIGMNHGFAISPVVLDLPRVKPDAVYFTDMPEFCPSIDEIKTYGGHDVGIFNYRDKTLSPCYYPCDYHSIKRIVPPPIWFTDLTDYRN